MRSAGAVSRQMDTPRSTEIV